MSDVMLMVTGADCLEYIDRPIGFGDVRGYYSNQSLIDAEKSFGIHIGKLRTDDALTTTQFRNLLLRQVEHDISKRIVGYVTNRYEDGGLRVVLLGNETLNVARGHYKTINMTIGFGAMIQYRSDFMSEEYEKQSSEYVFYPQYTGGVGNVVNGAWCYVVQEDVGVIPFDDTLDFMPELQNDDFVNFGSFKYRGNDFEGTRTSFDITNNENNTLTYGENVIIGGYRLAGTLIENPLYFISGDLYNYCYGQSLEFFTLCPNKLDVSAFDPVNPYQADFAPDILSFNGTCIPYNIVLTENKQFALEYLENGTVPPDAFLYPLDWNNLPTYIDNIPTGDEPEDYPDDNLPDDDETDLDPNLPETVSYTINQLTNYNWYWLSVPEWSEFIRWFWNDIGDFNDFDDIIAKVKGLYNDVASAVIMCRFYPVDYEWITGIDISQAPTDKIRLGMIEKANGIYTTISQEHSLTARDIGHIHIGRKYKSFLDMSPYSQLSVYLPFHGFLDLDNDLFVGHDLYVKALYDYLSGTIQYYLYWDNNTLVNTVVCKMAMDIPITLQTKNDRDSTIFSNVSSTVGGLIGAGVGLASGNPVGIALGATQGVSAINGGTNSAPLRVMGNVGESGAYVAPQDCYLIVRRPTIQPSDVDKNGNKSLKTWKHNVGMVCGYGYTLNDLSGFTMCHTPRIDFKNSVPLQKEVDEIYEYLQEGVIL